MSGIVLAPLLGCFPLRLHLGRRHLVARLRLDHQKLSPGFGDEVWHVLLVARADAVEDLKLPLGWLEPSKRLALENDCEAALGVGTELLQPIETSREAAKQQLADLSLVSR